MGNAFGEGIKYGLLAGVLTTGGVVYAHNYIPKFRRFMSISAKTSVPLMASVFTFAAMTEVSMNDMNRNPEKYGIGVMKEVGRSGKVHEKVVNGFGMPIHHRAMNWVHDHPFRMVIGLGLPAFAYILNENLKLKHLSFSQRIMATRVYAQGSVLSILATTMMIKGYVEEHGRFEEN